MEIQTNCVAVISNGTLTLRECHRMGNTRLWLMRVDCRGCGGKRWGVLSGIELIIILGTAISTSFFSTIFSYYKEKKFASVKYTERVLEELYFPIYKFLEEAAPDLMVGYIVWKIKNFGDLKNLLMKNQTRKSLGLPYDKHYASFWSFAYRFIRSIKIKRRNKKTMLNIKNKLKNKE